MTMFDERRMAELLHAASDHAPPSRVDLASVLRDGHRRRHRRRLVAPLAAAAAVAVAVGIVASVQLLPRSAPPVPPATPGPTPTMSPRTEFPLDRRLFTLDGAGELLGVGLTRQFQHLRYAEADVQVLAVGVQPLAPGGVTVVIDDGPPQYEQARRVPAPPVNGRPANFLMVGSDPMERLSLEFQWADGAWAVLTDRSRSEAGLLELAAGLRPADEPVRMLFSVQPPPGLQLAVVSPFVAAEEANYATLTFTPDGSPEDEGKPWVAVYVGQYFDNAHEPAPNAEVGGRPAYVQQAVDSFSVEMRDTDPFRVLVVSGHGALSLADTQALAASVVIHGTWEDRAQWTDSPLR